MEQLIELVYVLDIVGVLANALLGGRVAREHRLDPVGFTVLAILSGLGGGIIRDVLLQRGPPVALTNSWYLGTALLGAAVAYLVPLDGRVWRRVFPYVDALALGTWASVGAQKTLLVGLGWLPAILLGVLTAVGGGAVRDIALRRIPTVLGGNTLYATSALLASVVVVGLQLTGRPATGMILGTLVGAVVCLLARWRGWILPEEIDWRLPRRRSGPGEPADV